MVNRYDPRDLLSMVALGNGFCSAGASEGLSEIGNIAHIEYAQSLILANEPGETQETASAETASKFDHLVGAAFGLVQSYYGEERKQSDPNDLAAEIRYAAVMNHLGIRVSSGNPPVGRRAGRHGQAGLQRGDNDLAQARTDGTRVDTRTSPAREADGRPRRWGTRPHYGFPRAGSGTHITDQRSGAD